MLVQPGATEPVPPPPRGAPASFLRALAHRGPRALLVGALCSAAGVLACRVALPPSPPAVAARLRITPRPNEGPAALRRELAALAAERLPAAEVDAPPGGDTVSVGVRGDRAGEWVAAVNAAAEGAAAEMNGRARRADAARLADAEGAGAAARSRRRAARARLRDLADRAGVAGAENIATKQRLVLERLAGAEKRLRQARSDRAAEGEPAAPRARDSSPRAPAESAGVDEQLAADEEWGRLQEARAKLVSGVERLEELAQPGRVPPRLTEYRTALAGVERGLRDCRERVRRRLAGARPVTPPADAGARAEALAEAEFRWADEVRRLEGEGAALAVVAREAEELAEEADDADSALRRAEAEALARAEGAKAPPPVALESPAEAPPALSRHAAASALAAGCGIAVVLLGYGWRERRARRVRSPDDVTRHAGLAVLGTLPAAGRAVRRRLAGAAPPAKGAAQRRLTEAADALRTRLLHEAESTGLRVVLVTSAVAGEGKSALASLLAASLARAWRRTLLIDANLRGPAVGRAFGLPAEPGFAELLRGEAEPDDAVHATPVSRLWAIPAGRLDDHALQALAQDRLGPLLGGLRGQYDFVVIDAPPVLPVADALMLGRFADAAVLAVLCGASRLPLVEAARRRLEALGVRVPGAVVAGTTDC